MVEEVEFPQLVGPSYTYPSLPVDCQESVNFESVEIKSASSPYKAMLIGTPGIRGLRLSYHEEEIEKLPSGLDVDGRVRGIHVCSTGFGGSRDPALVVVCGINVWEIKKPTNGVHKIVLRGTLPYGQYSDVTSDVSMADLGGDSGSSLPPKLMISDGLQMHCINMDDYSFKTIGDADAYFRPHRLARLGAYVFGCGYDIDDNKPSQRVYWSKVSEPDVFTGDFISANTNGDPLLSVNAVGSYLWMVGTESYEIWQISNNASSYSEVITKVSGSADMIGAVSESAVASIGNTIFFVGSGEVGHGKIYKGSDNRIEKISSDAMDYELAKYKDLSSCHSFCYVDGSFTYYVVTFIADNVTWVYNTVAKCWHKRYTYSSDDNSRVWKVDFCGYHSGRLIVSGREDGRLYEMSRDILDDDGDPIVRRRVSPHIVKNGHDLRHSSFTLDVECGVGLSSGQGKDPQIMLRAIDDGGRTPREERWRSAGKQGAYRTKVKWIRLGHARDRVYEIKVSDPVKWNITGARIEVESPRGGR